MGENASTPFSILSVRCMEALVVVHLYPRSLASCWPGSAYEVKWLLKRLFWLIPDRIHSDDCDVPVPQVPDILAEISDLPPELQHDYVPSELPALTELWINLLHLTTQLEEVLLMNYSKSMNGIYDLDEPSEAD
jgi:hypothetical protein